MKYVTLKYFSLSYYEKHISQLSSVTYPMNGFEPSYCNNKYFKLFANNFSGCCPCFFFTVDITMLVFFFFFTSLISNGSHQLYQNINIYGYKMKHICFSKLLTTIYNTFFLNYLQKFIAAFLQFHYCYLLQVSNALRATFLYSYVPPEKIF